MRLGFACTTATAYLFIASTMADNRVQLPQKLEDSCKYILELQSRGFSQKDPDKLFTWAPLFDDSISKLAGQLDDNIAREMSRIEGQDIYAKFVTVAWHKKTHPEIFDEIENCYINMKLPRIVPRSLSIASPSLSEIHATEQYRLAWEYLLLSPSRGGIIKGVVMGRDRIERATEALEKIHNHASILTVKHMYQLGCQNGSHSSYSYHVLISFRDEQGLRALLECLPFARKCPKWGSPEEEKNAWPPFDPDMLVYKTLRGYDGHGEEWRKVIEAFPKDSLPHDQRQLLEKVLKEGPMSNDPKAQEERLLKEVVERMKKRGIPKERWPKEWQDIDK